MSYVFAFLIASAALSLNMGEVREPINHYEIVSAGSLRTGRSGHSATLLKDGKVLITGGMVRNGVFLDTAEIYDPALSESKILTAKMTTRRVGHSAVLLPDGRVFIAGGWINGGTTASTEIYDPKTGGFTAGPNMSVHRARFHAVLLREGKVLLAGGDLADNQPTNIVELFDPVRGRIAKLASLLDARVLGTATQLRDGSVLFAGGRGADGRVLASAERYEPTTARVERVGELRDARYKHTAGLLPDGKVLIAGGSSERDWSGQLATAEIFDPAINQFSRTATLNEKRFKLPETALPLASGELLVAGGAKHAEVFDAKGQTFTPVTGEIRPEHYMTELALSDGRIMLAGGYDDPAQDAQASVWIVQRQ